MSERMGLPLKNLEKSTSRAVLEVGGWALSLVIITQMTRVRRLRLRRWWIDRSTLKLAKSLKISQILAKS